MKKYSIFISCFLICFISLALFSSVKADAVTTGEGLSAVKAYESMGGKITSKKVFTEVAEKGGELVAKKGVGGVAGHFIPVVGELWTAYDIASSLYPLYQLFLNMISTPVQEVNVCSGLGIIHVPLLANGTPETLVYSIFLTNGVGVEIGYCPLTGRQSNPYLWGYNGVNYSGNLVNVYESVNDGGTVFVTYKYFNGNDTFADGGLIGYGIPRSSDLYFQVRDVSNMYNTSANPSYTYTNINIPTINNDISNNFPNGCNYAFPPSIDVNSDFDPNIYDTLVATSTVATDTPALKDVATVDNFGNPVDSQSGSVTPSNKPKGTSTGLGDFFDSIFTGIWGLLKGILDFFGGLIKLLTDMLLSLLVPRDGYFTDFFGGTRDLFNSKLSLNTNIDIFSPTYVNNAGDGGLTSVSYPIFGTYNFTIPFDILNPYLPKIREIMKGLIYPLIVFFNFNNIYKLIRGGSILNAAADSMNSKG